MANWESLPKIFTCLSVNAVLRAFLWLYQACISPFLGAQCRHLPTCSQYAIDALNLHGPLRGSWYTLRRIMRCHPLAPPIFDPVPPVYSGEGDTDAKKRTPADGHGSECRSAQ